MKRHTMITLAARKSYLSTCQSTTEDKGQKPERGWRCGGIFGNNVHKVMLKRRAERRDKESMIKSELLI